MAFANKRALVTGGTRGIGRGIVESLINAGAEVYTLAKNKDNLEKLKDELPTIHIVQVDLEDWESTRRTVTDIGDIDLLVNNAAFGTPAVPFTDFGEDLFDKFMNTNLKSPFNISQVVARNMIERNSGGAIVHISSIASSKAINGNSIYCISKAGLDMLTKAMALELGPHKIRVNSVNPSVTLTDMSRRFLNNDPEKILPWKTRTPLGKLSEVKDVVQATLFLLSEEASMITGTSLFVDGGWLIN